ncbi:AAA family ATPase [Glutamicibacter ardleyensis]|uniref:Protein CR006 P-loop domain-containing protein n=1 Tax=Glutamicibacter ardleyensis TaxID=225894 RepID=A0ABQ2D6J1_9MICC|nr:AAA family ATPase [Glutamicibacter ardleyensis]GGJ47674.1 hypothetical protein GCM10007173_02880 [Glutamicibacter ardleyensis]
MLTGIKSKAGFRGLCPNIMNGTTFGQTTIIFGRNGSGKTSITEAIRQATAAPPNDSMLKPMTINGNDTLDWDTKVFVFNRYYVSENLAQFIDGSAGAGSITLGSKTIADKKEKIALQAEQESKNADIRKLVTDTKSAPTDRSVGEKAKAELVSLLSPHDQRFHSTLYKNDRTFQGKIAQSSAFTPNNEDHDSLVQTLSSAPPEPYRIAQLDDISVEVDESVLNATFAHTPAAAVAEKITGDPGLLDWLGDGLHKFVHESDCPFCTQEIPADRFEALRGTFTDEHSKIKNECKQIADDLDRTEAQIKTYITNLETSTLPNGALNTQLVTERNLIIDKIKRLASSLREISKTARLKSSNPEAMLTVPTIDLTMVDLTPIRNLQAQYDALVQSFGVVRQDAIDELENRIIAVHSDAILSARSDATARQIEMKTIQDRLDEIELRLTEIVDAESDTSEMASQISNTLRLHLGREDLEVRSSGKEYSVLRHDKPAEFLSDGERNVISFIYFLKSLDDIKYDSTKKVVIIDDPVNSLDGENSASCVALISKERKKWSQTVLLTHNFDFLKSSMRALGSDGQTIDEIRLLQTGPVWDETEEKTQWRLEPMTETLRLFPSEYHYLFWSVASAASGLVDAHHLMALGNVGRRLLEAFLSYKRPATPDLRQSVESAWTATKYADELRPLATRTLTVLNHRSHEQSPTPASSSWAPLTETDFKALLYTIKHIDSDHFEQMTRATNFDNPPVSAEFIRAMRPYNRTIGALTHGQLVKIQSLLP